MAEDEEWSTVSIKGQNRSREIEVIRQRYREHLAALQRLGADSPTERLANEYRRLQEDIQRSIGKLDEIDGGIAPDPRVDTAVGRPPSRPASAAERGVEPAGAINRDIYSDDTIVGSPVRNNSSLRVMLIALVGIAVLAILGFFVWRASSHSKEPDRIVEQRPAATQPVREEQPAVAAPAPDQSLLKIVPASADYGTIRKGTRAVRQFEITNGGTAPVPIRASRSNCRCLFYEYAGQIAPKKKETITVTIDGAKAKRGALEETVQVASKNDTTMTASFVIHAIIK
jgi:Protein of unknown function (DUF1573)